jgi:hypothetical protein
VQITCANKDLQSIGAIMIDKLSGGIRFYRAIGIVKARADKM